MQEERNPNRHGSQKALLAGGQFCKTQKSSSSAPIVDHAEYPITASYGLLGGRLHYSAPVKHGKCGDYRQINRGSVVDKYPVPNLQTLFHRLGGSSIFSKVDLVKAYHQIPMDEDSIALTAITTPFGLFEYLYMPFGLRNASATLQRFIDHVLQGMFNAIAYVDDIIVFSNSPDEHVKHLNERFSRLKNFGVIVNLTKSQFGLSKLQFLGHVVTANGIKLLTSKVEVI